MMNRRLLLRHLLPGSLAATLHAHSDVSPVEVPVHCLTNALATTPPEAVRAFRAGVWDEAVRTFADCGVPLRVTYRTGEILKYPSSRPRFIGLERGQVNLVLTDTIPLDWDNGRQLAGGSTVYEGYVVCVIAMKLARGFSAPLLAVNTVVHELLHIFFGDVFEPRGAWLRRYSREGRVDWHATRMWLGANAAPVRQAARAHLLRMQKLR
jgi:hypothetical protein